VTGFSKTPRGAAGKLPVMNRKLLLLVFSLASAPAFSQNQTVATEVAELGWMAGHWAGPVGRAQSEEHWIAPAAGAMLGVSRTIARDRMVAFEFLRIEKRADGIFYVAQPGGRPPTEFKLTQSTSNSAVFENPKHDHPKIVTYRLDGPDTLVAKIEGDEAGKHVAQEFRFKKMAPASR
jgi:hypothetical protein